MLFIYMSKIKIDSNFKIIEYYEAQQNLTVFDYFASAF